MLSRVSERVLSLAVRTLAVRTLAARTVATRTVAACTLSACTLAPLTLPAHAQEAPMSRDARRQLMIPFYEQSFARTAQQLADKNKELTVRDLAGYAWFQAMQGNGAGAEATIRATWKVQDVRPDSPTYGEIGWNLFNTNIQDANSIEFGTHFWAPMVLGNRKVFSAQFLKDMQQHATAALAALERHHPPVSYTNIFLMNTDATILLSQLTGDRVQAQRGRQQLNEWLTYTSKYGIHEFDSPTYTGEALSDLSICEHYATDPLEHEQLLAALDYVWKEVALNMSDTIKHPLLGSHSRDYDFGGRTGGITQIQFAEGMTTQFRFKGTDPGKMGNLDLMQPGGFVLDAEKLRSLIPDTRAVTQRWGEHDDQIRYTYITPGFAVGTANGGDYGPQDRLYAVDFASKKDLPTISIIPDRFDAPYGLPSEQSKDKSGHVKPKHMPLHPVLLQKEGSVLALLDLDLTGEKDFTSAATDILLPSKADELRLGAQLVNTDKLGTIEATPDDVVGVREGTSCHAFRFVHVDPLPALPPVFELKGDDAGKSHGAVRFVVYHAQKNRSDAPKNLRVMMISETAECPTGGLPAMMKQLSAEHATFERSNGEISVTAALTAGAFAVSMKEDSRSATTATIDGAAPRSAPLAFDGHAIALKYPH